MISRERINRSIVLLSLLGLAGSILWMPQPSRGQPTSPDLKAQSDVSAEVIRLNQQVTELYNQGKYGEAIPLAKKLLAMAEKVLGPDDPGVTLFLNNLGTLYQEQGNYTQAEPLLQHSLTIQEKALGPDHPDVAQSLNNLATLYQEQGKYVQAEPLHSRALAIREKALRPDHPKVALSLNNLALLYQSEGDISRALEFLKRGIDIEEHNLASMLTVGSERRKRAYIDTLSWTTNATFSLHLQSAPNNPQSARLAFSTLLSRKGRILDVLTQSQQTLRQNLTPEDQKSFGELAATRTQLAKLTFNPYSNLPPEQYRKQLDTFTIRAEQLEDTLSRRSAEFRSKFQPATLEAVQKLIPKDAALVELVQY